MRTCVAASVLLLALSRALDADTRHLELELIDRARLSREAMTVLRNEVEAIWGRELSIEWTTGGQRPASDHVYVVLCRRNERTPPHGAIATIAFYGAEPAIHIHVHPSEALRLLGDDPAVRYMSSPFKTRNALLGRVLGRAIAHEVGHYILKSPRHSRTGLMKATHPIAVLASSDRSAFVVEQRPASAATLLAINDCSIAEWLTNSQ